MGKALNYGQSGPNPGTYGEGGEMKNGAGEGQRFRLSDQLLRMLRGGFMGSAALLGRDMRNLIRVGGDKMLRACTEGRFWR